MSQDEPGATSEAQIVAHSGSQGEGEPAAASHFTAAADSGADPAPAADSAAAADPAPDADSSAAAHDAGASDPGAPPEAPTDADQAAHLPEEPVASGSVTTADPRVDDALSRLSELDALPLGEQVEVYTDIHRRLAGVLSDPDSQA